MATYHAIAAIGQALVRLLTDASKSEADFASADFRLAQAPDFQESANGLGVLVFLYRVSANGARRNLPPRQRPGQARTRPPLPLDLYYLLSPWAANADTQQRLLGWTMRTLDDTPILPVALLNADDASPDAQTFYPEEAVEIVYDPLSLQDLASLWEIVKPRTQAGATYVARMVAIESTVELVEAGLVQTRDLGFGTPVERVPLGDPAMIQDVRVLDRVSIVSPLGLRFQDAATGAIVGDGLSVTAYPLANPDLRSTAYVNRSGLYVFRGLPGLRDLENGTGDEAYWRDLPLNRAPFAIEVVDLQRRFQPCLLLAHPPERYLRASAVGQLGSPLDDDSAGIPLFSTPNRVPPAGLAVVRAELQEPAPDGEPPRPAAWAVLEVTVDDPRADTPAAVARGVADEQGRVAVLFPYPPLSAVSEDSPFGPPLASPLGSPLGSSLEAVRRPLALQVWEVRLNATYQPLDPVPSLPDLADLLGPVPLEPHLFEDVACIRPLTPRYLQFGQELVVKSTGDAADRPPSVVFVTAIGSPL